MGVLPDIRMFYAEIEQSPLLPGPKSSDVDMKESTTLSYHKGLDVSVRDAFMGWVNHGEDSDVQMGCVQLTISMNIEVYYFLN